MSVQAMSWALDHSKSKGSTLLVLLSIANHCGKYGDNAWPGQTTIAQEARVSRNTVINSIDELERLGEVMVYPGSGQLGRGGMTNRYEMPKVDGWEPPRGITPRNRSNSDTGSRAELARSGAKPRDLEPEVVQPVAREPSFNRPTEPKRGKLFTAEDHTEDVLRQIEPARAAREHLKPKPMRK